MNSEVTSTAPPYTAAILPVRGDEGTTPACDSMHNQYGRRIEPDGTWTVCHVFSGIPAEIGGRLMADLDEVRATETMKWVNASNAERRRIARRNLGERHTR